MILRVGSSVHYRSYGSPFTTDGIQVYRARCRPAMAVEHLGATLWNLYVVSPTGTHHDECAYDAAMTGGTWHLPGDACD